MIYATYEALMQAYESCKIDEEEYRKYFSRVTGVPFDGYPDFSRQYFEGFLPKKERSSDRRYVGHWVIVKSLCNSFGDIIAVRSALVFLRKKDAMSFLSSLKASEPGSVAISSRELVVPVSSEYFSYKVVEEERK